MVIDSTYPPITVPPENLWRFLFERTDRDYPDNHGEGNCHAIAIKAEC